jgi:flagellar hook-associated protein 2
MAIQLSGLASGLDWKSLIDQLAQAERAPQTKLRDNQTTLQNQKNAYAAIQTQLGILQNAVNTLKEPTLFDSRSTTSSNTSIATASADSTAAQGSYTFNITQLATASKRSGTANVGNGLSATSDVSGVTVGTAGLSTAITAGTFSVNGQQITVATTDTLQQVFDKIAAATGNAVTAIYDPTTDKITLAGSGEVVLGSATDTSNFLQVTKLANNGTGTVTSSSALGGVRLTATLSAANLATAISDGGSGSGEFKINGVSIAFNASTDSVANVLSRINGSAAGVTASYDSINDRFVLTSKATGDMDITLQDVTGNFLAATGLSTSTLAHGKNLLYTVDGGDQLVSQSNTITASSSDIAGLSVTALTTGTTTVSVASDTSKITSAINDFISAYNSVQSLLGTDTASSTDSTGKVTAAVLASDSDADDLGASLRRTIYAQVSGLSGVVKQLADLGIDTNGQDNTIKLSNADALSTALQNNLQDVKQLFTDSTNGIATQLSTWLDHTIGDNGTVIAKQTNLAKQSSDIDTQIADMEKVVQADIAHWNAEFSAMESAQSTMNQQLQFLQNQKWGS